MKAVPGSLLIVARHFPPAVSGGARRPFVLAEGLRERGWRVHVASPAAPPGYRDWIETPHPAGLRGEAAAAEAAGSTPESSLKSALRKALYWPDGDMRWAFSARSAVLGSGLKPDWMLTTSPPESAHLAGCLMKAPLGARWLAEFRDSWIDEPLREELRNSAVRRGLERRLARLLLRKADAIVGASPKIAEEAARLSGRPVAAVVGHFAKPPLAAYRFEGAGPHLLHAGRFTLSHPGRVIDAVLSDFAVAAADLPGARLHLVGRLTGDEGAKATHHALSSQIFVHGEVDHDRALAMQHSADGLILYQPGISALPGKLGEYLLTAAPILTVGQGSWIDRLGVPHFPLRAAKHALAAPRRQPTDSLGEALDRYEAILLRRAPD